MPVHQRFQALCEVMGDPSGFVLKDSTFVMITWPERRRWMGLSGVAEKGPSGIGQKSSSHYIFFS